MNSFTHVVYVLHITIIVVIIIIIYYYYLLLLYNVSLFNIIVIIIICLLFKVDFVVEMVHILRTIPSISPAVTMNEDRFEDGDFLAAIERFTEAITLNRNNFQLFCQRSAAYARIGRHNEALEDAKRCHELKPDYAKVCTTCSTVAM